MQRNVETFERQTSDLLRDIAPELVALPADTAVKILNDRLIAARAAETRRAESQRRIAEIALAREAADVGFSDAEGALLARAAKLPVDADLTDILDRLTERDSVLDALGEHRT
jgi:hypothetical protein